MDTFAFVQYKTVSSQTCKLGKVRGGSLQQAQRKTLGSNGVACASGHYTARNSIILTWPLVLSACSISFRESVVPVLNFLCLMSLCCTAIFPPNSFRSPSCSQVSLFVSFWNAVGFERRQAHACAITHLKDIARVLEVHYNDKLLLQQNSLS